MSAKDAYMTANMIAKFMSEDMILDVLIKDLQEYKADKTKEKPMSFMMLLLMKWSKEGMSFNDIAKSADEMEKLSRLHKQFTSDN